MSGLKTITKDENRLDNVHPGDILREDFLVGSTIAVTPLRRARSMLSPKGKNASLPRQTPVTLLSHFSL